jgi:peptidylprolyl isomerase
MTEGQPIQFPQGRGRVIPGWDQGFEGMKIGGKRRLFIPYQLAYGSIGRPPVIPPKSDLIFDIELVDVTDMPAPGKMGMPPGHPPIQVNPAAPGQKPAGPTGQPASPTAPASPAPPPTPAPPAPSTSPATTTPPAKPANPAQPNGSN